MTLTDKESRLLYDLRLHAEGCNSTHEDGSQWRTVYLDNVSAGYDERSFAALCGCLAKKGFYRELDEAFGEVLMVPASR